MNSSKAPYMEKLTPAADKTLEELVEDFRSQLLARAADLATDEAGDVQEISVRDVVDSFETLRPTPFARRASFIDRILTSYLLLSILGLVAGIVGQLLFYRTNEDIYTVFVWVLSTSFVLLLASVLLLLLRSGGDLRSTL